MYNIIINAVFPTLILLVLGNVLRRTGFLSSDFWTMVDKLTYFVLFPALLTTKVSQVNLDNVNFYHIFGFIIAYFVILSAIAYGIYHFTATGKNQLSSIYQGIIRFNSYIYFALIGSLWGYKALALSALFAGIVIPIVNVCCILSFANTDGRISVKKVLNNVIHNPLIISAFVGFIVNLYPILMPEVLFNSLDILAKAALPLALLSVGAAVRIKMLFKNTPSFSLISLWLTTLARLLIAPAIAFMLSYILGINDNLRNIMILFAAVPTATSSFILSKQLRGNTEMMATIISLETVLSLFSLTFILFMLV